jgi:hypothetical protein
VAGIAGRKQQPVVALPAGPAGPRHMTGQDRQQLQCRRVGVTGGQPGSDAVSGVVRRKRRCSAFRVEESSAKATANRSADSAQAQSGRGLAPTGPLGVIAHNVYYVKSS